MSHVMRKPVLAYANNNGEDQPEHPRSLISAIVVRCLDSAIPLLATAEISRLWLVSVAEQAGLSLTWSQTPKTGFLVTRLSLIGLLRIMLQTRMDWSKRLQKWINLLYISKGYFRALLRIFQGIFTDMMRASPSKRNIVHMYVAIRGQSYDWFSL